MSQIQQVKEATNILEVIGERIQLQRSGSNWRAVCPFHSEKTPSFFVSDTLQRYKCFGCSESGDAFTFLEKFDQMTFYEALEELAQKAGITLEKRTRNQDDDRRAEQIAVLELAKEYYHYLLLKHRVGEPARQYLKKRGITSESVRLFQLGFAPDSWDGLLNYLTKKKKYPSQLLEDVGLVVRGRAGRLYDRFRGRVIFPLKDHRGRVVGFSGRMLKAEAKEAKYINSPETALYHKSALLFGWSELKSHIKQANSVIVTEGEFDVISSTQAGVNNVVAIKGSALTDQHAQLIKRLASQVLLALDTDNAGIEATKRAIQVLEPHDLELRIVQVSSGKDPDDLARQDPSAWRQAVKHSISAYQFLIETALNQHDATKAQGKKQIIQELAVVLTAIESQVEQEFYLKLLAEKLNTKPDLLLNDLKKYAQKPGLRRANQRSEKEEVAVASTLTRHQKLERYAVFLLLKSKSDLRSRRSGELVDLISQLPELKPLVSWLNQVTVEDVFKEQASRLAVDQQELLMAIWLDPEYGRLSESVDLAEEWRQNLVDLQALFNQTRKKTITQQLGVLDIKLTKTPQEEQVQTELLEELAKIK
ncbi:MAG: DNA primase [Patescibacteria group bacterium]